MRIIFLLSIFYFIAFSPVVAQEHQYDLNKTRMKIMHLLNFFPADNTLVPPPGSGTIATPTPAAPAPGAGLTRIYIPEATGENVIGAGTFTAGTGYRLQITKQIPLVTKTNPSNKYYMWLVKTASIPPETEKLDSFDAGLMPLHDKTYPKNLSDYNELVITEESGTTVPTTPNLGAKIMTALQGPAATPTPVPPTPTFALGPTITPIPPSPTPGGGSGSSGGFSLGDFLRGIFGF